MNISKSYPLSLVSFWISIIPITFFVLIYMSGANNAIGSIGTVTNFNLYLITSLIILIFFCSWLVKKIILLSKLIMFLIFNILLVFTFFIDTGDYQIQVIYSFYLIFLIIYTLTWKNNPKFSLEKKIRRNSMFQATIAICFIFVSAIYGFMTDIKVLIFSAFYILFVLFVLNYAFSHVKKGFVLKKMSIVILISITGIILLFVNSSTASLILLSVLGYFIYKLFLLDEVILSLIDLLFDDPYKLLISSFGAIILIGTIILSLPISSASGYSISFIDALFTTTSAVCITGLTVLDTGSAFSFFGQFIILLLIQIGGIGIITISTFIALLMGRAFGIKQEYVISDIIGNKRPKFFVKIIKFIIFITFSIELIGAIFLSIFFSIYESNYLLSIWKGIFHSVSAFCNAGFALQINNLVPYQMTFSIPIIISSLIVLGGLGFTVLPYLFEFAKLRFKIKISIEAKVTLGLTFIFLIVGYIFFYLTESNGVFREFSFFEKNMNAFFQSVTARTAGFNTINTEALSDVSQVLLWFLMFIGAGSVSTAGGIKLTTFAILIVVVWAFLKNKNEYELFGRRISHNTIRRAMVLFMASIVLVFSCSIILMITQKIELKKVIFETISAFGTVGLSIGATEKLDSFGKLIIILLMYVGRLGPLTFISLFIFKDKKNIKFPEEKMIIG